MNPTKTSLTSIRFQSSQVIYAIAMYPIQIVTSNPINPLIPATISLPEVALAIGTNTVRVAPMLVYVPFEMLPPEPLTMVAWVMKTVV